MVFHIRRGADTHSAQVLLPYDTRPFFLVEKKAKAMAAAAAFPVTQYVLHILHRVSKFQAVVIWNRDLELAFLKKSVS